ncbi:MAG: hypothetical protein P8Y71_28880 [Pseudolabrys sp.]
MSTLEIRAPHAPKSGFGGVHRLISVLALVVDAFNDALRQAHEAERRYPFTAW